MPDDARTVDVSIPVEPAIAAALRDARARAAMGRLLSRVLRPEPGPTPLARAIAEARTSGLTDADIDAELEAYNAERRNAPAA